VGPGLLVSHRMQQQPCSWRDCVTWARCARGITGLRNFIRKSNKSFEGTKFPLTASIVSRKGNWLPKVLGEYQSQKRGKLLWDKFNLIFKICYILFIFLISSHTLVLNPGSTQGVNQADFPRFPSYAVKPFRKDPLRVAKAHRAGVQNLVVFFTIIVISKSMSLLDYLNF
jgi:hypothetical protein